MNYIILKTVVESTIQNYNQQYPTKKVNENHVTIQSMNKDGIDMVIKSPHDKKEIHIHAQINLVTEMTPSGATGTIADNINDNDVLQVHQKLTPHATIADMLTL